MEPRCRRGGLGGERAAGMSSWRGAALEEPTYLRPFGGFFGSITEVTEWLMHNILGIANICDSLNHVHKVGGIGEILHGIIHGPSQLIPNEVEYAKTFLIRCHPI
jgi:hypothetical protein